LDPSAGLCQKKRIFSTNSTDFSANFNKDIVEYNVFQLGIFLK